MLLLWDDIYCNYRRLKKQEMRYSLFPLLENEFNCRIFFNGTQPREYKITSRSSGCCHLNERVVIVRWRRDYLKTLNTLFHEVGHVSMHSIKKNEYRMYWREIEADMVASAVFEILGLPQGKTDSYSYEKKQHLLEDSKRKIASNYRGPNVQYEPSMSHFNYDPIIRWDIIETIALRISDICKFLTENPPLFC